MVLLPVSFHVPCNVLHIILILQVAVSLLRANISSLSSERGGFFVDPAEVLRDSMTISAILTDVPAPESAEDLTEFEELKVCSHQGDLRIPS